MSNEKKITFFFGAGAEAVFGMPLGAQYTLDTILSKRSQMMAALKDFYSDRTNAYSSTHVVQHLFSDDSHTFREIVHRAARILRDCEGYIDSDSKRIVELSQYDTKDTAAAKRSIIIIASLNCSKNFCTLDFFFFSFNLFSPCFWRFTSTSSVERPLSTLEESSFATSSTLLLYAFIHTSKKFC